MHKQTSSTALLILLLVVTLTTEVSANTSVGVKKGDWIEYQVTITGTPPPDHDITWARMDVTNIQGGEISLDVLTKFVNETVYPEKITLNLETGVLGDDFIIPTNLNIGDSFHDAYQGDIAINGMGRRQVAGAERTLIFGATEQTNYYWDQKTGVIVEATSAFPAFGYSMKTEAIATNLWEMQILGLDSSVFYVIMGAVAAVVVIALLVLAMRRKNR